MAKLGVIRNLRASHGSKIHEHDFLIEFSFEGEIEKDMVKGIDFHEVSKVIDEELEKLSGKYLNEFLDMRVTVENLGLYLLERFLDKGLKQLVSIKIYEDKDRYIEVFVDEDFGGEK